MRRVPVPSSSIAGPFAGSPCNGAAPPEGRASGVETAGRGTRAAYPAASGGEGRGAQLRDRTLCGPGALAWGPTGSVADRFSRALFGRLILPGDQQVAEDGA